MYRLVPYKPHFHDAIFIYFFNNGLIHKESVLPLCIKNIKGNYFQILQIIFFTVVFSPGTGARLVAPANAVFATAVPPVISQEKARMEGGVERLTIYT